MSITPILPSFMPVAPEFNDSDRSSFKYARKQIELKECEWASNFPEVQKACFLSRVCTYSTPKCCRFNNILSILQDGPTCGLTALSMIFAGNPKPADILKIAKEKNYTYNGEMFSAKNLHQLICDIACTKDKSIHCSLHKGRLNCAIVKDSLKSGACIFVPYDPDFNHGPCLKMGHKAHWALIIGILVDDNDEFYVIARHGKTKNIAVWDMEQLSASNSNLTEFAQPKGYPDVNFLLPIGGLGGDLGLMDRSIIVNGVKAERIVII